MIFLSCETEQLNSDTLNGIAAKAKVKDPVVLRDCLAENVDRCPFEARQPAANFWWPENDTDYFNPTTYFASTEEHQLKFTEYDNGTANISGSTTMGSCVVTVDIWLKNKKSWAEWSAEGGEHKKEGCAGDASNEVDMNFYVIDSEKSALTAVGGDCIAEGTFGIEQRPDPSDDTTPNYGAHIGPGGANYDSELGAEGLSTWAWITDMTTGERLWVMDFNFTLDCKDSCETAFARGENGSTCFGDTEYDFSRWGWTIGPLTVGDYSYDIYAGAGQCDISKGVLVGTVDVSYKDNGDLSVTYNINDEYSTVETHTYAGNAMFPMKNGQPTVAPGQYEISENLEGEIYVIAHAVVCAN